MLKVGLPTLGTMQGDSATPIERVLSSAFWAMAATSSSDIMRSAAAPAILKA